MNKLLLAVIALALPGALRAEDAGPSAARPGALIADGIPPVPQTLVDASRPYMEFRTASFADWNPVDRSMLIATRFGNVAQLHTVAAPGMDRRQISFEAEPVGGSYAPNDGILVVSKDKGGNEFWQLYTLKNGRLTLLTDGRSRNAASTFSADGKWLAYSSTRRNGADSDLYIVDPRDPATTRMVAQVSGGG